jgi:hypothetical protein
MTDQLRPWRCADCHAAIDPLDDDAGVCIQCGGMNNRLFPAHCCQQCGEPVGYIGRAVESIFGSMHKCLPVWR